jgi:hypothetical protein
MRQNIMQPDDGHLRLANCRAFSDLALHGWCANDIDGRYEFQLGSSPGKWIVGVARDSAILLVGVRKHVVRLQGSGHCIGLHL